MMLVSTCEIQVCMEPEAHGMICRSVFSSQIRTLFSDCYMTPDLLARSLDEFLSGARNAVVVEEGQILFDLGSARYSVSSEHGKCLLHMWSEERNIVRQVLESEVKNGALRLSVRKFAQARPHQLEIRRAREYRTPTARKAARN